MYRMGSSCRRAALFCLVLPLGACLTQKAATQGAKRPAVHGGEFGEAACFRRRAAEDFRVLDDRNLIVFAPGRKEAYHVQTGPPGTGLRLASRLAFDSRSSMVCGYAGDSLLVEAPGGGFDRMPITGVYWLDEMALSGLEARFSGEHGGSHSSQPQEGLGAEIERRIDEIEQGKRE